MLAIDQGSTGIKVAVVDADAVVRGHAGETFSVRFCDGGGAEQDADEWWAALGRCSRRALAASGLSGSDVSMIAVTSQYSSIVAVAADGSPLAPVLMWMDRRGKRYHPLLGDREAVGRWIHVHGMVPSGSDDIGHVSFIRNEWPDVYAAAAAFVEPVDHLCARLTGRVTATQNSAFPLLAIDNRRWGTVEYSPELVLEAGLDPDKLPMLLPFGEPRGRITAAAADHLGVSSNAMVMSGTIDSVTTAIGTGAIDSTSCGLVIGTTSVMVTHVDSKREDLAHGLATAPSAISERWFIVAENGIGGKALDVLVRQLIYPDDGLVDGPPPADAFERVTSAAGRVPAGANGVMFFPWLVGSMAPAFDRHMRGAFVNLGLTSSRTDLARSVLEGVAFDAAWLLPHLSALAGATYDEITLGGGGAQSSVWGQIIADALGIPVRRLSDARTTNAHGAALLALVDAGHLGWDDVRHCLAVEQVHEPDHETHLKYRRLTDAFVDFHQRTAPFFHSLNARR